MRIILASTSRYRRELVKRLNVPVESLAPPYDEDADKETNDTMVPRKNSSRCCRRYKTCCRYKKKKEEKWNKKNVIN